jgi:hypothetical protein
MSDMRRLFATAVVSAAALLLAGAVQRPRALATTAGGIWEISGVPGAAGPVRQCVADTALLARIEHRGQTCTQVMIEDRPTSTVIHYTCPRAGFGRSEITVITPRSLRIETQGISNNLPFNFVAQARRVGSC